MQGSSLSAQRLGNNAHLGRLKPLAPLRGRKQFQAPTRRHSTSRPSPTVYAIQKNQNSNGSEPTVHLNDRGIMVRSFSKRFEQSKGSPSKSLYNDRIGPSVSNIHA
jgi:hypothetical protein